MRFAIQINASPYASYSCHSAYQFVTAALNRGHLVPRIFFYQEGVYNAAGYATVADDECNMITRWSELATQNDIDLVVCVSAAQRRGLIADQEAAMQQIPSEPSVLARGFRIGGLGQAIEAIIECDRFILFGRAL